MPSTTRKRVISLIFLFAALFELVERTVLFQGLVQGNLTKSQALEVDSVVRRYLDLQVRFFKSRIRIFSIPDPHQRI
jgi:hypothetical protein